jgi:phospholipid-binding lipoprotein MlaA
LRINFNAIKKIALQAYIIPAALIFILLSGCSTIATKNSVDPWESWNRSIFNFNDSLDAGIVKPIATAYVAGVPSFVRTGVNNFFSNLTGVWTVVNSTLQLKPQAAVETFFRVTINTFLGLGGVLDVASEMNIERHTADFGQTLGHYGVPPGPYLVIPLLGSSTLRDTLASTLISRGDLVWQLNSVAARNSLYALRLLDTRANLLRTTSVLEGVALDKYTFTRIFICKYVETTSWTAKSHLKIQRKFLNSKKTSFLQRNLKLRLKRNLNCNGKCRLKCLRRHRSWLSLKQNRHN